VGPEPAGHGQAPHRLQHPGRSRSAADGRRRRRGLPGGRQVAGGGPEAAGGRGGERRRPPPDGVRRRRAPPAEDPRGRPRLHGALLPVGRCEGGLGHGRRGLSAAAVETGRGGANVGEKGDHEERGTFEAQIQTA